MSYALYNNGKLVARYSLFVDAWLQAYLDFPLLFSVIMDNNDVEIYVVVNPRNAN